MDGMESTAMEHRSPESQDSKEAIEDEPGYVPSKEEREELQLSEKKERDEEGTRDRRNKEVKTGQAVEEEEVFQSSTKKEKGSDEDSGRDESAQTDNRGGNSFIMPEEPYGAPISYPFTGLLSENCTIGVSLSEKCHLLEYSRRVGIKRFSLLEDEKTELISRRTGLPCEDNDTVCLYHEQKILTYYPIFQKKCCDPLKKHKRPAKKSLREISLRMAKNWKEKLNVSVIPGNKLCPACLIYLHKKYKNCGSIHESGPAVATELAGK
ncbi:hypothetical protein JZ751_016577 [Albula glossodonta]|uniref:Uncharacterized protein n=1 Tax=Albula glossodonta TaxID=121402 RepID=A0A8T2MUX4_9TELE|nr:hypothetical protein JZ751_016577 [Albula glossodonta]